MAQAVSDAAPTTAPRRGLGLRARLVRAAAWLACRLPEPPLLALADVAGSVWFRLATERRRRARRNLTRVVRWLADHDLGTPEGRAAAHDGRALTHLVREAFKFSARYYVQLARALHKNCELGAEVPPQLYGAVAKVLAFVMGLKARGSAAGVHRPYTSSAAA